MSKEKSKNIQGKEKLDHYNTQNLLARSLHPQCYQNNPGFRRVKESLDQPFKPHDQFKKRFG